MSEGQESADLDLPGSNDSLWRSFAHSVRDNVFAEMGVQVLRVGGMVVLARILAPADFGLLKVLLIVAVFATLACEFGVPDAVIQRKVLTLEHEATALWLSLGLVSLTVALLYIAAPLIARSMAMPELSYAIRLLCLPIFFEGSACVAVACLSRQLRFGALAVADVVAEVAFLAAAFIVLWRGNPRLSLVIALGARFTVHALAVWIAYRRMPLRTPRIAAARGLGRFAVTVFGGRIVTSASGNAVFLLVGRLLGTEALGFYSMAWDLLRFVPDRLHRVAGRVAFPAFCKLQDDTDELGAAYLNFIGYIARIVLPIAGCVAIAAPELITTIYGPQWRPAITPMRVLALGVALVGLRLGAGAIYFARNVPSMDIYVNGARLLLVVVATVAAAPFGLVAVAASIGVVEGIVSIGSQLAACRLIAIEFINFLTAIMPGIRTGIACLIATFIGQTAADLASAHGALALVIAVGPAAATLLYLEGGATVRVVASAFNRGPTQFGEVRVD